MREYTPDTTSVLVIGASRGLGEAIVETYEARGAPVVATVRSDSDSPLRVFADEHPDTVEIEHADVTVPATIAGLRQRLEDRRFDVLFVVAGISLAAQDSVGVDIDDRDFALMMQTNVLGVMRAVEGLDDLVASDGTVAVMSSGQGSVSGNTSGGFEVYRATKAALNQMFRSYAVRNAGSGRSLVLLAPGWVRTEMGGANAVLEISESIPPLVDVVESQRGVPGLQYLDRHGHAVGW